ncbi:MAG: S8 family serine peptidase [Chloroflexota bacterium]
MRKITPFILVVFLISFFFNGLQPALASTTTWVTLDARPNKLDPVLQASLKNLQPADLVTVIVILRQRADLSRVTGANRHERQRGAILALETTANSTQGKLKTLFNTRRQQGLVQKYQSLWIINGFSLTAKASVINELAQHPDVYSISPDAVHIVPAYSNPELNITQVNAPALWSLGFTGQGVVVANMDTGVNYTHPDLSTRWRGGTNSWFDPYGAHSTPVDSAGASSGHGTETMGVMVAGQAGGTTIGVAPDAKWIAVKIFDDAGNSTATAIHSGFQWLLDPDGNPNTADAPDVVNNSWANGVANACDLQFENDLQSLRAAGILPVFAAGNYGSSPSTSTSPANNPSAFAVGNINGGNNMIWSSSSRGPTTCSTGVFPDIVAPGYNINSTDLSGLYTPSTGTSLSAPHVAGALALLLSAFPNLTAAQQESALINSAVDLGPTVGPDNTYGYGRLDILAAYNLLNSAVTTTPTSTATATLTSTPTATATNTLTPTATASPTNTATATATSTFTPTLSFTPTNTSTATASFTSTVTKTATPTASSTNTSTVTASPTNTLTATATYTSTATPSQTPTGTLTVTFTPTRTASPTNTSTATATASATATKTATATSSQTSTSTLIATYTPASTVSPTLTSTATATKTSTPTFTPTFIVSPTSTSTATATVSPANTATATPTAAVIFTPASIDSAKISFQEIASGLTKPVFITNAGDGTGRIFIVEQPGRIRIQKNGILLSTPFLDVQSLVKSTGSEQGLLALAFDPAYTTNGNFYVVYTAPRSGDSVGSNLILEKFSVSSGNPDVANLASGTILLTISHPTYGNHNGGTLAFGHDGYLYWSTGDGGSGGDPANNAQQLNNLLGKLLRIDVHSGSPYAIPTSNPFYSSVDPNVKKEIWAYGLRNSWRISFDRATHDLYIGDVGQDTEEEVDFQSSASAGGQNYGWRILEGNLCYNSASNCVAPSSYVPPVTTYDHGTNDSFGCSITGGYVYRGSNFPSLTGYYLFGDYCTGRLFSLYKDSTLGWKSAQLLDTPYTISSFGEDEQGELYLADYATGKIYNIRYQEASYTISGNVGAAGATLSYMDGTVKTLTSLADGSYSFLVSYNWSGTVTPTSACYSFSPSNRSYSNVLTNQTAQNYTATYIPSSYTLTGNTGVGGVTLSYTDGTPQAVTSDSNGNYSISVPCNWSGTLTPSKIGYLFAPAVRPYTYVAANKTGQNYNLYTVSSADYNGDRKADVAVFRPSNSTWYIQGQGAFAYGQAGDIPVPADYNGDGKDEIAVFRPSNSTWYIQGQGSFAYGAVGDIPVIADYNGDGKADIAVFRPRNSTWYIQGQGSFAYGQDGDIPVVADYNGDGKADIAVFRPTNSTWYIYGVGAFVYGTVGDIPVIADYNGDGQADVAVFRPSNSTWYLYGIGPRVYGTVGDIPVIGDYNGDGRADVAVFRPGNSTWYLYGVGAFVYGAVGDIPV